MVAVQTSGSSSIGSQERAGRVTSQARLRPKWLAQPMRPGGRPAIGRDHLARLRLTTKEIVATRRGCCCCRGSRWWMGGAMAAVVVVVVVAGFGHGLPTAGRIGPWQVGRTIVM